MSEENQGEKQIKKVFFFNHQDNLESNKFMLLKLYIPEREYITFIKQAVKQDKFYIPVNGGYIKLWNDKKDNILFFESSRPLEIFATGREVLYGDRIESKENIILCPNRTISTQGFSLIPYLKETHPEIIQPVLNIICFKLF
jgi:hypothetical protein